MHVCVRKSARPISVGLSKACVLFFFCTKCPTNIKRGVEWEMFGGGQRRKIHYMVNRLFKGPTSQPFD